jgi:hypothetical protein
MQFSPIFPKYLEHMNVCGIVGNEAGQPKPTQKGALKMTNQKPYIARDTGEPLVVMGGYHLASDGSTIRKAVDTRAAGDYGHDPIGCGLVRMVPSGDIVTVAEASIRLGR